jgi:ProP effector
VLPKKRRRSEVSASNKNGSLMPSAGTIPIWKSTFVVSSAPSRGQVIIDRAEYWIEGTMIMATQPQRRFPVGTVRNDPGHTLGGTSAMSNGATKVETAIAELAAVFPAAFTLDPTLVRPVKLGINGDIYAQFAISRHRIKAALRAYCNRVHYLRASTEGVMRIDLTGEPAGTVTATEARHATERLAVLAKVAAKRAGKIAAAARATQTPRGAAGTGKPSPRAATAAPEASDISKRALPAEPASPGQKRLSLGDLKRAAAARKAMR